MTDRDELQQELATLESDLEVARGQLDSLRAQRDEPDALPDTSDDAVLIREFEDQREIVAQLEARERALREQLG
jgi:hypothetical protein